MTQAILPETQTRVPANVGKATFRLPPLRDRGSSKGFGVKMVSRNGSQSLIYRSVPPRPLSYTFTDILETYPHQGKTRSKTAPVSINSPEDYAQRFKSRPTTRPTVVEFDGNNFNLNLKKRGVTGFCPSVRLKFLPPQSRAKTVELPDLQLEPSRSSTTRQKSTSGRHSSRSTRSSKTRKSGVRTRTRSSASTRDDDRSSKITKSSASVWDGDRLSKENPKSPEPAVKFVERFPLNNPYPDRLPDYMETPIVYPNIIPDTNEVDDLTMLPPPKKVMPRKDAPWVYRFKVKRNMNALSKIMASKPSQVAVQTSLDT